MISRLLSYRTSSNGSRAAGELGVGAAHAARLRGVDEHAVQIVEEVVAGRAVHRPSAAAAASRAGQDLLGDDVERPAAAAAPGARPSARREILEHREVRSRDRTGRRGDRCERPGRCRRAISVPEQHVRRLEHFRLLDPQAGQRVDVEEAPVVDLVRGRAPVATAGRPALRAARAARSKLSGVPGRAVDASATASSMCSPTAGDSLHQPRQPRARDLLLALPFGDARRHPVSVYGGRFSSEVRMLRNSCSCGLSAPSSAVSGSTARPKTRGACRGLTGSSCSK